MNFDPTLQDAVKDGPCMDWKSLGDRKQAHVFLDYAGRQLAAHLLELNEKDVLSEESMKKNNRTGG